MTERFKLLTTPGETFFVSAMLMATAGFLEVYTFLLKGGVFCNAQTGNVALLGMALAQMDWLRALYCLIPIVSYIVGILLTLCMPEKMSRGLRWETVFILFEIAVLAGVGFLPPTVHYGFSTVSVAFICSMQYNTFKKAHGIPMATTFCTNNLRQATIHAYHAIWKKEAASVQKAWFYAGILVCFAAGAFLGTIACEYLAERAIWLNAAALVPVATVMIYADVRKSARLERKKNQ